MATATFNFKAYNKLMEDANSGLRLYLALQMLQDVESIMRRFKSPLAKDLVDIVDELSALRDANKKYLANRDNQGRPEIEPSTDPTSSADYGKNDATK